jgi:hypothetical protein
VIKEAAALPIQSEQPAHLGDQCGVAAGFIENCPLVWFREIHHGMEELPDFTPPG